MRWVRHVAFNNGFVEKHVRSRPLFLQCPTAQIGPRPPDSWPFSITHRRNIHTHARTHVHTNT